jgi:hypothetical protein
MAYGMRIVPGIPQAEKVKASASTTDAPKQQVAAPSGRHVLFMIADPPWDSIVTAPGGSSPSIATALRLAPYSRTAKDEIWYSRKVLETIADDIVQKRFESHHPYYSLRRLVVLIFRDL